MQIWDEWRNSSGCVADGTIVFPAHHSKRQVQKNRNDARGSAGPETAGT
jgi:hypothetical protein